MLVSAQSCINDKRDRSGDCDRALWLLKSSPQAQICSSHSIKAKLAAETIFATGFTAE